ncbi:MAG: hypothetical protein HY699_10845 [Deltaproteobacteria bacterium]|nr:hypothetical protein [Deltaproteobacteria bacterium]
MFPLTIERALAEHARSPSRLAQVSRVYVLPFDVPAARPAEAPDTPAALVRWLFGKAEVVNGFDTHEICWDKPGLVERWLNRGVALPDSLLSTSIEEATAFVREHEWVLLKHPRSCGGHGHYLVSRAADGLVAEARRQRYELELVPAGARPQIRGRLLRYPAPFFLQRLVADVNARGVLKPAQLLRAYIVDGQLAFWTERYRPHHRSASDWVVATGLGAKCRFVFSVGEEVQKLALRAAEVVDLRVGVVDLIRSSTEGAYALAAYTDGHHMIIDREFKQLPEFRDMFDFDRMIAELLVAEPAPVEARATTFVKKRENDGPRRGRPPQRRAYDR